MVLKQFTKNDNGFVCECCGYKVEKLGYTSRDHCPNCLVSKHVDVFPGDRQNKCAGLMIPTGISVLKDGYIIEYTCSKCGEHHRNKSAEDDNFDTILSAMNKSYKVERFLAKK